MDLASLARKYIWWQPPEQALRDRHHLIAQVMNIGTHSDVEALRSALGDEELKRDALDALSRRREWPDGMRRYIASLYELDIDTWHESPTSSSARLQSA